MASPHRRCLFFKFLMEVFILSGHLLKIHVDLCVSWFWFLACHFLFYFVDYLLISQVLLSTSCLCLFLSIFLHACVLLVNHSRVFPHKACVHRGVRLWAPDGNRLHPLHNHGNTHWLHVIGRALLLGRCTVISNHANVPVHVETVSYIIKITSTKCVSEETLGESLHFIWTVFSFHSCFWVTRGIPNARWPWFASNLGFICLQIRG